MPMPSAETLRGLLEMVEAASGPDQVLDAHLISVLLAPPGAFVSIGPITGRARICVGVNGRGADVLWDQWLKWVDTPLTGSVDAALAFLDRQIAGLIEVSWSYESSDKAIWPAATVRWYPMLADAKGWRAEIGSGATIPLTILAALLRALIAQSEEASR